MDEEGEIEREGISEDTQRENAREMTPFSRGVCIYCIQYKKEFNDNDHHIHAHTYTYMQIFTLHTIATATEIHTVCSYTLTHTHTHAQIESLESVKCRLEIEFRRVGER